MQDHRKSRPFLMGSPQQKKRDDFNIVKICFPCCAIWGFIPQCGIRVQHPVPLCVLFCPTHGHLVLSWGSETEVLDTQ